MALLTIADRRARDLERLREDGAAVMRALRAYAIGHEGVRFMIFGSFARGEMITGSDFDVVVDGPDASLRPACAHVERLCERFGLRPDVYRADEVSPGLKLRIDRDAIVLP